MIREFISDKQISVQKTPSADNVVDPLTKPITQQQLDHHLERMDIGYHGDWL